MHIKRIEYTPKIKYTISSILLYLVSNKENQQKIKMSCGLGLGYAGLNAPLAGYGLDFGLSGLNGYHGLGLGSYGSYGNALASHGLGFGLGAYGSYGHLAHAGLAAAPLNGYGLGGCGSAGLF